MDFDPSDGTLYATLYTGGGTGVFCSFDLATGNADIIQDTTPINSEMEMVVLPGGGGCDSEICPDVSTIIAGFSQSGSSADICAADDTRWGIQSTTFDAVFAPAPIQVEFDGNAGGDSGDSLTFTIEGHAGLGGGSAFLLVLLWNFTTGQFDGIPFANQPDGPPDIVYAVTVDNSAGDYVDVDGSMRAKIDVAKTNPGPVRMFIDQAFWTFN